MSRKKNQHYSASFKMEVLVDYYSSGKSMGEISRKWNLSSSSLLIEWKKHYPVDSFALSLSEETIASYMKQCTPEKSKEEVLSEEIVRLRKALEIERIRSRAFEKLIEITEKEEGISILKKGGTKQ